MAKQANRDSIKQQISNTLGDAKLLHTNDDIEAIIAVTNGFKERGYKISYGKVAEFITAEENRDILEEHGLRVIIASLPRMKLGTIVKSNKIGRNDPCICGSGKKYKKCCLVNNIDVEFKEVKSNK